MRVQVAPIWIYHFYSFSQVFNLFSSKGFSVNKGYNRKEILNIKVRMRAHAHIVIRMARPLRHNRGQT